jgi:phage terminase large subunit
VVSLNLDEMAERLRELTREVEAKQEAAGRRESPRSTQTSLALWRDRPDVMVEELFGVTPDPWQREVLRAFPTTPQIAMKASKGCGKSCVDAWLIWNFLLTRAHARVVVVSISGANLDDALWTELAVWYGKAPILRAAFEMQKTRIISKSSPETWWASARTWPRQADPREQASTLSGVHGDRILFVLDECGAMPDAVLVSAQAALSSCIEGHLDLSGNPTNLDGVLYTAAVLQASRWLTFTISGDPDDPQRAPRVGIEWAREQVATYGRDNPWVMVNVFGQFPPAAFNSLVGPNDIEDAYRRQYAGPDYQWATRIVGVDVAGTGADSTAIVCRQGPVVGYVQQLRHAGGYEIAHTVLRVVNGWGGGNVKVVVDGTGGWAGASVDAMRAMGLSPIPVGFAEKADNPKYANRRAEMYFRLAQAIKEGLRLPPSCRDFMMLAKLEYSFQGDKLLLEAKEGFKSRVGQSPDVCDALALTYAIKFDGPQPHLQEDAATMPMLGEFSRHELGWQNYKARRARDVVEDYHPIWSNVPRQRANEVHGGSWKGIGTWDRR